MCVCVLPGKCQINLFNSIYRLAGDRDGIGSHIHSDIISPTPWLQFWRHTSDDCSRRKSPVPRDKRDHSESEATRPIWMICEKLEAANHPRSHSRALKHFTQFYEQICIYIYISYPHTHNAPLPPFPLAPCPSSPPPAPRENRSAAGLDSSSPRRTAPTCTLSSTNVNRGQSKLQSSVVRHSYTSRNRSPINAIMR